MDGAQELTDRLARYYLQDAETRKLKTVGDDDQFFADFVVRRQAVVDAPHTASQRRMKDAVQFFTKQLVALSATDRQALVDSLEHAVVTTCRVATKAEAAQIFIFHNDRGKNLTALERVKALFVYQLQLLSGNSNEDLGYLEYYFSEIYKRIELVDETEDNVLRYHVRAYYFGYDIGGEVTQQVQKRLNSESDKVCWIRDFVRGLSESFKTAEKIRQSADPYLNDLKYLGRMAVCYPFLLKANSPQFGLDDAQRKRLYRLLENIVFRVKLLGSRAVIEDRLNWHLKAFNGDVDALVRAVKHSFANEGYWNWYWGNFQMQKVLDVGFYGNPVDNYLLWKYEGSLKQKGYGTIAFDLVQEEQIEHIAPQTPRDEPLAEGYAEYTDDFKEHYINKLGNLMLIGGTHNRVLGNKAFKNKLASYQANDSLSQHTNVRNFVTTISTPVWDEQCIDARHKKLVDFAMANWDIQNV